MTRNAPRPCPEPGCFELVPCPAHPRKPWQGKGNDARLGKSGWQRRRDNERTMRRHGGICHVCGRGGADRIDHIVNLAADGSDDEDNRAPIHSVPCHRDKTQREAAAGRRSVADGEDRTSMVNDPAPRPRRRGTASVPLDPDRGGAA
jgi:5-methylcytosine-specific restriction endonuclease McrA